MGHVLGLASQWHFRLSRLPLKRFLRRFKRKQSSSPSSHNRDCASGLPSTQQRTTGNASDGTLKRKVYESKQSMTKASVSHHFRVELIMHLTLRAECTAVPYFRKAASSQSHASHGLLPDALSVDNPSLPQGKHWPRDRRNC